MHVCELHVKTSIFLTRIQNGFRHQMWLSRGSESAGASRRTAKHQNRTPQSSQPSSRKVPSDGRPVANAESARVPDLRGPVRLLVESIEWCTLHDSVSFFGRYIETHGLWTGVADPLSFSRHSLGSRCPYMSGKIIAGVFPDGAIFMHPSLETVCCFEGFSTAPKMRGQQPPRFNRLDGAIPTTQTVSHRSECSSVDTWDFS
jgi:hypothetical protein